VNPIGCCGKIATSDAAASGRLRAVAQFAPRDQLKEVLAMHLGRITARVIIPLALATFVATGCGGKDGVLGVGGIPSDAFCTVDGTPIKTAEFERMFDNAEQQYEDNGRDFPKKGTAEYDSLRSDLVEYLVQQGLIRMQAEKFDLAASKKEIDKGIKDLKEQVAQGDEKKFEEEMKRVNYTLALVKQDVEFDVISKKLYEEVVKDIKVSDADAKEYYEENKEQFATKESREIAHILVKEKAKANEIYEQVKGGDEKIFAKLAKQYTLDPSSKETGGVLPGGSVQRGQTVPEFDKVSFELETGEVSKPVKTSYGWHVITARGDVKPAAQKPYKEVKEDIKKQVKGEQEGERYTEYNTDVRKDAEDSVLCRDGFVWKETLSEKELKKLTDKQAKEQEAAAAKAPAKDAPPAKGEATDAKKPAAGDEKPADEKPADQKPADEKPADGE
jgi:foldase protein PrsA